MLCCPVMWRCKGFWQPSTPLSAKRPSSHSTIISPPLHHPPPLSNHCVSLELIWRETFSPRETWLPHNSPRLCSTCPSSDNERCDQIFTGGCAAIAGRLQPLLLCRILSCEGGSHLHLPPTTLYYPPWNSLPSPSPPSPLVHHCAPPGPGAPSWGLPSRDSLWPEAQALSKALKIH